MSGAGDPGGSRVLTVEGPEAMAGLPGEPEIPSQMVAKLAPQSMPKDGKVEAMEVDTLKSTPEGAVELNGDTSTTFETANDEETEAQEEEAPAQTEPSEEVESKASGPQANVKQGEVPTQEEVKERSVDSPSGSAQDEHVTDELPVEESTEAKPEENEGDAVDTTEEGEAEEDSVPAASKEDENSSEKPKFELPYSTRGRHHAKDGSEFDVSSRGYRDNTSDADWKDIASDLGFSRPGDVVKETAPGTSFLDSLSEEERRLRTRYLPEVDGIRSLHKSEIKRDVLLARSIMSSTGVAGTLKKSRGRKPAQIRSSDEDRMDVEEEDGIGHSEDERASDVSSGHSGPRADLETGDVPVGSAAFVAPPDDLVAPSNGELSDRDVIGSSVPANKRWRITSRTPLVVDSITAFNPPRPPESVGLKKKNRMIRWERRPQDVEHDLRVTRKTVQRCREELHRATHEYERITTFGAVTRTHFLNHLEAQRQESIQLNDELASIQVDCVKAADLLTSRTRSRGVGKGVYVMRDVISVLKTRGASLGKNVLPCKAQNGRTTAGVGGVGSVSFVDWDESTNVVSSLLANAWLLPGDKVQTPYGDGVALHVFGPTTLNVNHKPVEYARSPPAAPAKEDVSPAKSGADATNNDQSPPRENEAAVSNHHGFGLSPEAMVLSSTPPKEQKEEEKSPNGSAEPHAQANSNPNATGEEAGERQNNDGEQNAELKNRKEPNPSTSTRENVTAGDTNLSGPIILPRVCVRLPFGIGFFQLDAVTSKEDPSSYSDAMLAARWQKMVEVAKSAGGYIDVAGMERSYKDVNPSVDIESDDASAGVRSSDADHMDVDANNTNQPSNGGEHAEKEAGINNGENANSDAVPSSDTNGDVAVGKRFVPLGAGLFPTASSRGALLANAPQHTLEEGVDSAFSDYSNDLGRPNNPGVPEGVKSWEAQRYEACLLRAKVLQLRNELYRQRRIRTLNERTFVNSRDRSHRAENLLTEMKSDLGSLKDRLEEELYDLGIDEEAAEDLLSTYLIKKDTQEPSTMDATPPPKRKRKLPKEQPRVEPKHTRRRAADSAEDTISYERGDEGLAGRTYNNDDDKHSSRMSGDDMGMDQSSDDDVDQRVHKRSRIAA